MMPARKISFRKTGQMNHNNLYPSSSEGETILGKESFERCELFAAKLSLIGDCFDQELLYYPCPE
jgi:hypothetical protein